MTNDNKFSDIKGLEVVMIYGSIARNDADIDSDIDIFALTEDFLTDIERVKVVKKITEKILCQYPAKEVNVSLYTYKIFNNMSLEGSLFLWHLKKEGKYLYNKRRIDIFLNLASFNGYQKNMELYKKLFTSVQISLKKNGANSYDLSLLFFLCRNISILTCFKIGNPDFGRLSAYKTFTKYLGYQPVSHSNFIELSKWRIDYTRGLEEELKYPNKGHLKEIVNQVSSLLNTCEKILKSED